jgi:hypothetical protein
MKFFFVLEQQRSDAMKNLEGLQVLHLDYQLDWIQLKCCWSWERCGELNLNRMGLLQHY